MTNVALSLQFNFERQIISSPVETMARFGTTLSRLGDINHDGYNGGFPQGFIINCIQKVS